MVTILAPSGRPARAELRRVQARHMAGQPSPNRGSPAFRADSIYRELSPEIRRRLVDESCDLDDNFPFVHGLLERLVTYVIGTGLWPYAETEDDAWNAAFDAVFAADAEEVDIRGGISWEIAQEQLYRTELREGDSGGILTTDEDGSPKILLVEGRNIGDPLLWRSPSEFDGVTIDAIGRRLAYRIMSYRPDGQRSTVDVAAENFVHVYSPDRIGSLRGVPLLASALMTARDMGETIELEKVAVKTASGTTDIIETETGTVSPEEAYAGSGNQEDPESIYRKIVGPEAKILKRGDKWVQYRSDRPGPAWLGLMEFLGQSICLAARIPPSVLLQIKVGGADTRRDLAAAQRVFERIQLRLCRQLSRIVRHFARVRVDDGTLSPAPDGWEKSIAWQTPKAITVDAGREAQQDREDYRAGLFTKAEFHGRFGVDWRKHSRQRKIEVLQDIKDAKEISESESIPFELALQLLGTPPGATDVQVEETARAAVSQDKEAVNG